MSKKFTEEQYQDIANISDLHHNFRKLIVEKIINYVIFNDDLIDLTTNKKMEMLDKALALSNPVTREWAHEQFVEEKRYAWTLKKVDKRGIIMRLYKEYFGRVQPFFSVTNVNIDDSEKLTEKEIREWGYNPEMFDKEEVE